MKPPIRRAKINHYTPTCIPIVFDSFKSEWYPILILFIFFDINDGYHSDSRIPIQCFVLISHILFPWKVPSPMEIPSFQSRLSQVWTTPSESSPWSGNDPWSSSVSRYAMPEMTGKDVSNCLTPRCDRCVCGCLCVDVFFYEHWEDQPKVKHFCFVQNLIYFNSQDHEPKARLFQAICVGQVIVMPVEHTKKIAGDWLGSHTCVTNNRFTSTGTIDHQLFFGVTG